MSLTETLPRRHAATNRMAEVFQKLEESRPLAVRLAGNSTAGQTSFSDDPRSTWGFNPLGYPQKPASREPCSRNYVSLLVTHLVQCKHIHQAAQAQNDVALAFMKSFSCENERKSKGVWSIWKGHEASLTSCIIQFSNSLWGSFPESTAAVPATERTTVAPVVVESPMHIVEVNMADFLDPLDFDWTDSDTKAAEAARSFNEHVYADH